MCYDMTVTTSDTYYHRIPFTDLVQFVYKQGFIKCAASLEERNIEIKAPSNSYRQNIYMLRWVSRLWQCPRF